MLFALWKQCIVVILVWWEHKNHCIVQCCKSCNRWRYNNTAHCTTQISASKSRRVITQKESRWVSHCIRIFILIFYCSSCAALRSRECLSVIFFLTSLFYLFYALPYLDIWLLCCFFFLSPPFLDSSETHKSPRCPERKAQISCAKNQNVFYVIYTLAQRG